MKLADVLQTRQEILGNGHTIENNIINAVDVNVLGHYGDCCSLEIRCDDVMPCVGFNNTKDLGYLIRSFVELLEISMEDGLRLRFMRNIPVRLIFENGRCVGFGHFMKDRFVYTSDFVKITE